MRRTNPETVMIAATSFGVSIGVSCCPTEAAAVIAELPRNCDPVDPSEVEHRFALERQAGTRELFRVRRGSAVIAPPQPLTLALMALQNEIYLAIAEHARAHVFVHAGVVAWKGQIIILPGSSYAGKSTLVWSLVEAGGTYYSDEYAVFDEEGRVHPFALPISLRSATGEKSTNIPARTASGSAVPDVIAFAQYRPGKTWNPQQLSPGTAMLYLMRHSIAVRTHPEFVLRTLKKISLQAVAFAGVRGDCGQLLRWVNSSR